MGKLRATNIEPQSGTNLTLGTSGDSVTFSSTQLRANTFKDVGGNTLWTSDGSGTLSSINSGLQGGAPTLLATNTSADQAQSSFTSLIDSTYEEYWFVVTDCNPATDGVAFTFNGSTDAGSSWSATKTTTFVFAHNSESGSGTVAYVASWDQAAETGYQYITSEVGNEADESCCGILQLYNPASTSLVKQFMWRGRNYHNSNVSVDVYVRGYFDTTSAINGCDFKFTSGNMDGVIQMYGVG